MCRTYPSKKPDFGSIIITTISFSDLVIGDFDSGIYINASFFQKIYEEIDSLRDASSDEIDVIH